MADWIIIALVALYLAMTLTERFAVRHWAWAGKCVSKLWYAPMAGAICACVGLCFGGN